VGILHAWEVEVKFTQDTTPEWLYSQICWAYDKMLEARQTGV